MNHGMIVPTGHLHQPNPTPHHVTPPGPRDLQVLVWRVPAQGLRTVSPSLKQESGAKRSVAERAERAERAEQQRELRTSEMLPLPSN